MSTFNHLPKMNEYRNYACALDAFMQPLCTDVAFVLRSMTGMLRDMDMARLNADVAVELQRGRGVVDARTLDEAHDDIGEALRDATMAHRNLLDSMTRVADSVDHLRTRCIVNRRRTFEERFDEDTRRNEVLVPTRNGCHQCSTAESELIFNCGRCDAGRLQTCMECGLDYVFSKSDSGRSDVFPCWNCDGNILFDQVGRLRTP